MDVMPLREPQERFPISIKWIHVNFLHFKLNDMADVRANYAGWRISLFWKFRYINGVVIYILENVSSE